MLHPNSFTIHVLSVSQFRGKSNKRSAERNVGKTKLHNWTRGTEGDQNNVRERNFGN